MNHSMARKNLCQQMIGILLVQLSNYIASTKYFCCCAFHTEFFYFFFIISGVPSQTYPENLQHNSVETFIFFIIQFFYLMHHVHVAWTGLVIICIPSLDSCQPPTTHETRLSRSIFITLLSFFLCTSLRHNFLCRKAETLFFSFTQIIDWLIEWRRILCCATKYFYCWISMRICCTIFRFFCMKEFLAFLI